MTECDCLNWCGDDPKIEKRKIKPCQVFIANDQERAIATHNDFVANEMGFGSVFEALQFFRKSKAPVA